jgi:hypothetical protein
VWIGHSLGAAIATLGWLDFGGEHFTFCAPRVGDVTLGNLMWSRGAVRVINDGDIVPGLPPDPPFRQGGIEIRVHGPTTDRHVAHALESVRKGIEAV